MRIPVSDILFLRPFRWGDEADIVGMLNHLDTYNNSLTLPYPFTHEDAVFRLKMNEDAKHEIPVWYALCIRQSGEEKPIGSFSIMPEVNPKRLHHAEIGYSIHPAFAGKGYTTAAVIAFSKFVFGHFPHEKLVANTFVGNKASERVLLKAGYKKEGILRGHYKKNGQFIDARTFGLLKDEI